MDVREAQRLFTRMAALGDEQIGLAEAAFLIAAAEYPELEMQQELAILDSLAAGASRRLAQERDPLPSANVLSQYLFDELGFHGNQQDYYDPRNSYLNEVLRRRVGIPITLSLVYMEIGRRLGVPLVGVGMPGHFLVRHRDVEDLFIDPFYGGILLSVEECAQRLQQTTGASVPLEPAHLAPVGNRELVARMLHNLKGIYLQRQDYLRALRTTDWLVTLQPAVLQERRDRGLLSYRLGQHEQALGDLRSYLASTPPSPDTQALNDLVAYLERHQDPGP